MNLVFMLNLRYFSCWLVSSPYLLLTVNRPTVSNEVAEVNWRTSVGSPYFAL